MREDDGELYSFDPEGVRYSFAQMLARHSLEHLQGRRCRNVNPLLGNRCRRCGVDNIGSLGSGKTQAIKKLLETLRDLKDFRVMVLDRNGELMESFYNEDTDKPFNQRDTRSVSWRRLNWGQQLEAMAPVIVLLPQNEDKVFFA